MLLSDARQKATLIAAENGNLEVIQKWLSIDPRLIHCVDEDKYTPLHKACYGNHVEVIEVFKLFASSLS